MTAAICTAKKKLTKTEKRNKQNWVAVRPCQPYLSLKIVSTKTPTIPAQKTQRESQFRLLCSTAAHLMYHGPASNDSPETQRPWRFDSGLEEFLEWELYCSFKWHTPSLTEVWSVYSGWSWASGVSLPTKPRTVSLKMRVRLQSFLYYNSMWPERGALDWLNITVGGFSSLAGGVETALYKVTLCIPYTLFPSMIYSWQNDLFARSHRLWYKNYS